VRADAYHASAAAFPDQFYGQLAAERIGASAQAPRLISHAPPSTAERGDFERRDLVRAARLLGQRGQWKDQSLFVRAIAASVESEAEMALAAELSRSLGRPDLGVMVARNRRNAGGADIISAGFPALDIPIATPRLWTMIHAIARQESQFDREIVSHAGAMGLMQLMPGTARETAGKLGMAYDPARLNDPNYNAMLGSAFFTRLLENYGGNHVLAVAAYNAGPGNVRKWLAANGDPRDPAVDVIDWIEAIPFTETRGYVQRVLENAVIYDSLNPAGATLPGPNRLSAYLGKGNPG
jgi:soluble lytic murein transglycosylase